MKLMLMGLQMIGLGAGLFLLMLLNDDCAWQKRFGFNQTQAIGQKPVLRFKRRIDHVALVKAWLKLYQGWLVAAGIRSQQAERTARLWIFVQLSSLCLGLIFYGWQVGSLFFVGIGLLLWLSAKWVANDREAAVNMGVYKVYRFMHLQHAAGLSAVETLKHMHESTDLPHLKAGLRAYSTTYFRTMDPSRSEQAMFGHIRGQSASLLAATFKQGIEQGEFIELVKRQEEIMLKAFYKGLAVKSQALHAKHVLIACSICLFIFLLLLLPILYEMQRATEAIFSF